MQNQKNTFKRLLAGISLLSILAMLGLGVLVPATQALEIELDTGLEDSLCDTAEGTGVIECEDEASTTFTNFEGEFTPPEEEGYAEGITETNSAREFIVNVTNFVLSFLGLAGVVVVIYGGFLYVTAAGEQDQAEKGKKSITYAMMGIIIVLISYALVNTILGAASEGGDSSSGLYSSGGESSESLTEFQSQEMAEDIKDIAGKFVDEYTIYVNVVAILEAMAGVDDFDEDGLDEMEEGFKLITQEVDSLSNVYDVANEALQLIKRYSGFRLNDKLKDLARYEEWMQTNVVLAQETTGTDEEEGSDPYGIGAELIDYMQETADTALEEYQAEISTIKGDLTQMQVSFENLTSINSLFDEVILYLSEYESKSNYGSTVYPFEAASGNLTVYDTTPGGSQRVGEIVELLDELYNRIKELQFTTAIITANTKEANSPATITFDALDSSDPTNLTLPPENHQWDLLGNGFTGGADDLTGPNVSYTYEEPGTYQVALKVVSNDPENIASGVSYLAIKVNPPSSIITLTADPGSDGVDVTDLSEVNSWTVTGEQAQTGITFDASETTDGDGNKDTITQFGFDFGDGEDQVGENPVATHYYTAEGSYNFQLEVTDQNGVKDRKIVTIEVASPAAYVEASKTTAEIGEEITYDASGSVTDNGNITYYKWIISKDNNQVYEDEGEQLEEIKYSPEEPGAYTTEVIVEDSSGESDEASVEVVVNSSAPVATFTYTIPDSSNPSQVHFDASKSYDPDENDVLSYAWTIEGEEGIDYAFVEGTSATDENPIVEFEDVGEHDVTLTVKDQYEEPLQQTNSYTKTVEVESILGISVETVGESIAFLDENGTATISLKLESEESTAYEIDWQDGGNVETLNGGSQTVEHTYSEAGTYSVEVKVYDEENEFNEVIHNVYVGNGTEPIPVIHVVIDDFNEAYDGMEIEGNRTTSFKFDASESVDLDGTSIQGNNFSWDFGDGSGLVSGEKQTHVYEETGSFIVTLTAHSEEDQSLYASTTLTVEIVPISPEIYGLTIQPQEEELVTPLTVKVEVNAEDDDGEIENYKFWYYDVENSSEALDAQIVPSNSAYLTINTNGTTGEVKTYAFAVEVTDDENNKSTSEEALDESQIPTLDVENGPNKTPEAEFTVDRVNILVGEEINFTSTSEDEDGKITEYIWDFEGDGFYNNDPVTQSTLSHIFEQTASDGIEVRLKVIDEGGASDVSDPIRIYVDSLTDDPTAAFTYTIENLTVEFQNNSSADSDSGASLVKYQWDFDTASTKEGADSDGNGSKDDDKDSTEENPSYTYTEYGSYQVKLLVTDNEGNTDEVINTVILDESNPPEAAFTYTLDHKKVTFKNNSTVDAGETVTIKNHAWDFDLGQDTDGNGEADDDVDSTQKDPIHEYEDYGNYRARLEVTDSLGRTDEVTKEVQVEEPKADELEAFLTSTPEANPADGKIHLTGTAGNITFKYDSSGGLEPKTFCIDKNIYFDSNGNGKTQDDCNHEAQATGSYTTDFQEAWGLIVVQLTVTDASGTAAKVTKEVIFDDTTSANVLPVTTVEALYILATALAFTLLGTRLYLRKEN